MNPQLALFAGPAARRSDPATAHSAALSLPPLGGLERSILAAFAVLGGFGLTDDELCDRIDAYAPTVKSCRSRLAKRGLVVPTSERRPSLRGRDQIVWRLP